MKVVYNCKYIYVNCAKPLLGVSYYTFKIKQFWISFIKAYVLMIKKKKMNWHTWMHGRLLKTYSLYPLNITHAIS